MRFLLDFSSEITASKKRIEIFKVLRGGGGGQKTSKNPHWLRTLYLVKYCLKTEGVIKTISDEKKKIEFRVCSGTNTLTCLPALLQKEREREFIVNGTALKEILKEVH